MTKKTFNVTVILSDNDVQRIHDSLVVMGLSEDDVILDVNYWLEGTIQDSLEYEYEITPYTVKSTLTKGE